MMKQTMGALVSICLLLPAAALAHDASKHKGKPIQGQVAKVSADGVELKTAEGSVTVTFSSKTKFEHGKQTVDRTHVTTGSEVSVFGTKLPTGEVVAREVLIGVGEQPASAVTPRRATGKAAKSKSAQTQAEHKH